MGKMYLVNCKNIMLKRFFLLALLSNILPIGKACLGCHADTPLTIEGTVTKDISKQNTSSSYVVFSTPLNMLEGSNLILKTARYTYIQCPMTGEGRIDIYSGGERTYIGDKDKKSPDWSKFKGDVHIWP